MNGISVKEHVVGTWKLLSIFYWDKAGNKVNLYGDKPKGILMYDKHGYMNAQLGYSEREKMSTAAIGGGTKEEKLKAFDTFMAYYGKYYEREPGVVVHEIIAGSIPNWEGQDQIRFCKIVDGFLHISTPEMIVNGITTIIEVVWKKEV
jgi:hypothetical protein